jgi:hypothetical protein
MADLSARCYPMGMDRVVHWKMLRTGILVPVSGSTVIIHHYKRTSNYLHYLIITDYFL